MTAIRLPSMVMGAPRPALDLREIGDRGHCDSPLFDPGGAAVAHDLALDELGARAGARVRVQTGDGGPHRPRGRLIFKTLVCWPRSGQL